MEWGLQTIGMGASKHWNGGSKALEWELLSIGMGAPEHGVRTSFITLVRGFHNIYGTLVWGLYIYQDASCCPLPPPPVMYSCRMAVSLISRSGTKRDRCLQSHGISHHTQPIFLNLHILLPYQQPTSSRKSIQECRQPAIRDGQ